MVKIAPSMLSADFGNLAFEARRMEEAGADWLHLDVMDGLFVPNITFGMPVVEAIDRATQLPLDVHLMIMNPGRYVGRFLDAGADVLTLHAESAKRDEIEKGLVSIREGGKKAGLSIRPATPVSEIAHYLPLCDLVLVMTVEPGFGGQAFMPPMLEKVRSLNRIVSDMGLDIEIEVDGGINPENAPLAIEAGARVLVAGSSIFRARDAKEMIKSLRGRL